MPLTIPHDPNYFVVNSTQERDSQWHDGAQVYVKSNSQFYVLKDGVFNAIAGGGGGNTGTISAGTATATLGQVIFANSNGVTFGIDGQTITASVGAAGGGLTNINVSAGTTSNNLSALTLSNSNGVSFGLNGSVITATVQTNYLTTAMLSNAATISNINVSAGTTSNNLSAVTFNNANGITFGLNASTITASHDGLTSQSGQAFSAGGGSSAFQTLSFSNANGISFSNNAGQVQASYTVPTVTNSSWTVSDNVTSLTISRLAFTNSNGLTLTLSTAAGAATVVGSYTVPTQTNQSLGLYAVSNTTLSTSGTMDARTISFQGAGVASVGVSNGSVVISVPAGGGGLTNINVSAGTTSNNLSNIVFSNSNGVSFGLNGSTVTASAAAGGGGLNQAQVLCLVNFRG